MQKTRVFLASVGVSQQYEQINPPIGLLYIAAWLRQCRPVDIRVVSQREKGLDCDELIRNIIDFAPDIVGFGSMTPHAHALPYLVDSVRAELPGVMIVLGGPHVSSIKAQVLEDVNADAAVNGEGERSMEMLLDVRAGNGEFQDVPGLIWRDPQGEVVTNPGFTPFVEDMDDLPFPAYDLIDLQRYWRIVAQVLLPYPRKYILMITSRGCPYRCAYCSNMFGRRYRHYSADRMVEEAAHFHRTYGMDELMFYEDTFNVKRQRVLDFSEKLVQKISPLKISFPTGLRADLLDEETIDALVGAGMYCCHYALESGSPRVQKFIDKNLDIPKFLQAMEWSSNKGVFCHGYVMMGFPTETESELQETIRVASESRLHTAEFFTVTPWPDTPLAQYLREHAPEKLEGVNFNNEEYWRIRVNCADVSDKTLFQYQRKAYRDFYFRPRRLYRIARDYPKPLYLPTRIPALLKRMGKGLFYS